jgi:hypothetical protein
MPPRQIVAKVLGGVSHPAANDAVVLYPTFAAKVSKLPGIEAEQGCRLFFVYCELAARKSAGSIFVQFGEDGADDFLDEAMQRWGISRKGFHGIGLQG